MSRYYDDDYYHHGNDWEYYSDEENISNEEEDDEDNFSEETDPDIPIYDEEIRDETIVYTDWRTIKLGQTQLRVSNTGKVQYPDISIFMITNGLKEHGTPYRFVNVELYKGDEPQKYYVHDLVWRAFHEEDPARGFKVGHHNNTPFDDENCYSNELQYLDIYHHTICTKYKIKNII